jgi:hypothetical protein
MLNQNSFLSKKFNLKSTVLIVAITFSLVTIFSSNLTGNYYIAPGKIESGSKFFIEKNQYFSPSGQSQCDKSGGIPFQINGRSKHVMGKPIKVISATDDTVLISVNRAKRSMQHGIQKYVAGLYVTVHSVGTHDACLIIRPL